MTAPTNNEVDAVGFLIVEGVRSRYSYSDKRVHDAKVVAVRQSKPKALGEDQIAVKVTIRLPKAAFEALQPEAVLIVPPEMVQHPIVVEVEDP